MALLPLWYDRKMMLMQRLFCLSLAIALMACRQASPAPDPQDDVEFGQARLAPAEADGNPAAKVPQWQAYRQRTMAALAADPPVLRLEAGLDVGQQLAQDLALSEPRVSEAFRDSRDGQPLRGEVFGVYRLREGDILPAIAVCREVACYRVEIYNFALNLSLAVIVDTGARRVLQINPVAGAAPDLPSHLVDLAARIAAASPDVAEALGRQPAADEALMAGTKTALNQSRCERSKHLCVAPTFIEGDGALWAIVDLTEGRLVGLRWTRVGATEPVTEKRIQNEVVMREVCDKARRLERDGWTLSYSLTRSDGLKVADVAYQGQPVVRSAKLVDWHVSYSNEEGFGYSDAVGCPEFSHAAVVAVVPPRVVDLVENGRTVGFSLIQTYWNELWPQPCNYSYEQAYHFYRDGRFRPVATSLGRGCGDTGTYRPVSRIALAGKARFSDWDGAAWKLWEREGWRRQSDGAVDADGAMFRILGEDGRGWRVAPNTGAWGDGSRGDDAFVYVTRQHDAPDEGESDLVTLGPCCNTGYRQGPETFIEPLGEAIGDAAPLVLWYVAQLANDDTPGTEYCWAESVVEDGGLITRSYPCHSGPMFYPIRP